MRPTETNEDLALDGCERRSQISGALSALAFCYSLLTVFGWWFRIGFLQRVIPGAVPIHPHTALSFLLLSQVLREVKSSASTRALPVVILTSSREERDLVESYALGVNSYLQKPVDFEEFRSVVKQIGLYWLVVNQLPANGNPKQARSA